MPGGLILFLEKENILVGHSYFRISSGMIISWGFLKDETMLLAIQRKQQLIRCTGTIGARERICSLLVKCQSKSTSTGSQNVSLLLCLRSFSPFGNGNQFQRTGSVPLTACNLTPCLNQKNTAHKG
jgi:hypothetical protein